MSVQIENLHYSVPESINFDWEINFSNSSCNVLTKDILMKGTSTNFSLKLEINYYKTFTCFFTLSAYTVNLSVTLTDSHLMLESIDVLMHHKVSAQKFMFCLKKDVNNPFIFSTSTHMFSKYAFSGNSSWKVSIMYGNFDRTSSNHENKSLKTDLKKLFESEKHTDFSVKTQNKTFKVHKGIFSCRCDVLSKAIESNMIEKQNNEIQLDDQWDSAVVKEILSFIYTGSCELSLNPHQLFELANYYQLDELKVMCTKYLQDNMNLKNIVYTLQLADEEQYNLKSLQILARSFVKNNEATLIKDIDFQDYLSKSIKINNFVFILRLAYDHKLKDPLESAKKFIRENYKKVVENEECQKYLLTQGQLLLDILTSTLGSTNNND